MSLINRMLQDLDARRGARSDGEDLPSVRPLPAARPSRPPLAMIALAGFGAAALAAFLALREPAPALRTVPLAPSVAQGALSVEAAPVSVASSSPFTMRLATHLAETAAVSAPPFPEPEAKGEPAAKAPEKAGKGIKKGAGSEARGKAATPRRAGVASAKRSALSRQDRVKPVRGQAEKRSAGLDRRGSFAARPGKPEKTPAVKSWSASRALIKKTEPATPSRDRADAAYRKAVAAADQGRTAEAQESLRAALRADGLHTAARQLLVRLLLAEQRVDEAVQALREGLRKQPAQTGWAMTLARLQVDQGEIADAALTLRDTLPAASGNPDYLGFAGHLQQRLGHGGEAADLYRAAARLAPNDGRWWLGLGLAMESDGRNDQALAAFQRARECENLSPELSALAEQKMSQLE